MAKKKSDKAKLINDGVVVVKRTFEPLIQDYEKEKIPDYIKDIDHTAKLADDEYKALGKALRAAEEAKNVWPAAIAATRFLAFTGWRSGEALGLRWAELDLARSVMAKEENEW